MRREFLTAVFGVAVTKYITGCSKEAPTAATQMDLNLVDTRDEETPDEGMNDIQSSDDERVGSDLISVDVGSSYYIDVTKLGAIGDGIADSTQAFIDAIALAQSSKRASSLPMSITYSTQAEILVPPGVYNVNSELLCGSSVSFKGVGMPVLQSTNSSNGLQFQPGYKFSINGICFKDFDVGVFVRTGNLDTANVQIVNCRFIDCGVALDIDDSPSTHLSIERCFFFRCTRVLISSCDKSVMRDSWITSASGMKDQSVILNSRGSLVLEALICVPAVIPHHDQRWVDNHGSVTCRHCRFGSELGGFNVVSNFSKFDDSNPVTPNSVIIEDCEVYSLGNPARRGVVVLHEIPNVINIANNRGMIRIPAVLVDDALDEDNYLAPLAENNGFCRFNLSNNVNESSNTLPSFMQNWQPDKIKGISYLPVEGFWTKGAIIINSEVDLSLSTPYAWICVQSGRPGLWREIK